MGCDARLRAVVVGQHDRAWREVFSRNHRAPCTDRHEHPTIAQAVAPRPRPVPLAHTYRTFNLKTPLCLSWRQIYRQFGADPSRVTTGRVFDASRFRAVCLRELKKIKRAWPGLYYHTVTGGLVIDPSPPCIPPAQLHGSTNRPARSEVAPREAFGLGGGCSTCPARKGGSWGHWGLQPRFSPPAVYHDQSGSRLKFQQLEGHSPTSSETSRKAHSTISESSRPPFHLYQPKGLTGRWPVIT